MSNNYEVGSMGETTRILEDTGPTIEVRENGSRMIEREEHQIRWAQREVRQGGVCSKFVTAKCVSFPLCGPLSSHVEVGWHSCKFWKVLMCL